MQTKYNKNSKILSTQIFLKFIASLNILYLCLSSGILTFTNNVGRVSHVGIRIIINSVSFFYLREMLLQIIKTPENISLRYCFYYSSRVRFICLPCQWKKTRQRISVPSDRTPKCKSSRKLGDGSRILL